MAVGQKRWLEADAFDDGVALCQVIPGATAMQVAAYVGFATRGVAGAAASFIGFGLPTFVLMTALAASYARFHELAAVAGTFRGLQAVIVGIIANAAFGFWETTIKGWPHMVIAGVAAASFGLGAYPLIGIGICALLGLVLPRPVAGSLRSSGEAPPLPGSGKFLGWILPGVGLALLVLRLIEPKLFELSAIMLRVDLFAFGGGFASVPLMFHEVVEVRHWLEGPTFMDGIVLGQMTPGPIVITATFVGYLVRGLVGAAVATVSMFLPSFLMVVGIAPYHDRLRASPVAHKIIDGALCSFVGLLLSVTVRFAGDVSWNVPCLLLAAGTLAALLLRADILWVVLTGAVLSFALR
jgi:chromate transporter